MHALRRRWLLPARPGDVISLLWFKRKLPKYATKFIEVGWGPGGVNLHLALGGVHAQARVHACQHARIVRALLASGTCLPHR